MAARRAVEAPKPLDSPTPAPTAVATAVRPPAKTTALPPPTIGKAEKQLLVSFLVTAAIAFTFMVLIPVVLRLVRNF